MKLLIVESPNKIKYLKEFLGREWLVSASVGHFCDLPDEDMGIDIKGGTFEQVYEVAGDKKKVVSGLKELAGKAPDVYLATDPDREGEAISWHLARLLKLDMKTAKRVTFNAITKEVVLEEIKKPRTIDLNVVEAYKARRAIDRIYGYELSPAIQRFGLQSAGRCQTPCLNIVVQREEEITNFKPRTYYALKAIYKEGFTSEYAVKDDNGDHKVSKIESKESLESILTKLNFDHEHKVVNIKSFEEEKRPKAPFIKNTVIAQASAKLKFKPKKTDSVLQSLFEKGFITYPRTDSPSISDEGLASAHLELLTNWPDIKADEPVKYKAKASSQGAHECIRPTHADDSKSLEGEELALYTLIRNRFLASQCKPQVFKREDILLTTDTGVFFIAKNMVEIFPGFTKIYEEDNLEEKESEDENNALIQLDNTSVCHVDKYNTPENQTKPPSRFKLATLSTEIEKQGIGRPATFSSIVQTPLDRGYYEEDKKGFLIPTEKGKRCIHLLKNSMPEAIVADYTRDMEDELDNLEKGKSSYLNFIKSWYSEWSDLMGKAHKYFLTYSAEHPEEDKTVKTYHSIPCPVCGSQMLKGEGKFGAYAKCVSTTCNKIISLKEAVLSKIPCKKCGTMMEELKGKFGKYYKCPGCGENVSEKAIKFQKAVDKSAKKGVVCSLCGAPMIERKFIDKKTNKPAKFWGCSTFPKCKGTKNDEND